MSACCCHHATAIWPLGRSQGAGVGVVDHEVPVGSPGKAWLLRLIWPGSKNSVRLLPEAAALLVVGP